MDTTKLFIGVDLDNTIVSYDEAFHQAALEENLIPSDLPATKTAVRSYLRKIGRERQWTLLQGLVYGRKMRSAQPFSGALEFFAACCERKIPIAIVSHRTRTPIAGPPQDLHAAALEWLKHFGFSELATHGIFLEETRENKARRAASCGCSHFIDDLPEFLAETGLPAALVRIWFNPGDRPVPANWSAARSWTEIKRLFRL